MKDWKTYAIIVLAIWCFANTDWQCGACKDCKSGTPNAVVEPSVVTQRMVVIEAPAAPEADVADTPETVVAETSAVDSELTREYRRFKQDQHLRYLKTVKASRASWVAGNHDHKGFDYKIFLEQYVALKGYPTLLKNRLDALRAEDARLSEMVADDIRKYE